MLVIALSAAPGSGDLWPVLKSAASGGAPEIQGNPSTEWRSPLTVTYRGDRPPLANAAQGPRAASSGVQRFSPVARYVVLPTSEWMEIETPSAFKVQYPFT